MRTFRYLLLRFRPRWTRNWHISTIYAVVILSALLLWKLDMISSRLDIVNLWNSHSQYYQEDLRYCMTNQSNENEKICGKQFPAHFLTYLHQFGLSDSQTSRTSKEDDIRTMKLDPMFISAFSANHYQSAKQKVLSGFKKYHPDKKLIAYDLGLNQDQIKELKSDPQIEIRAFNFSRYPAHVSNLMGYHWKFLVFAEALQRHGAILHMDAHVHVLTGDTAIIKEKLKCNLETPNSCNQYPMSLFWNTGHSTFAATDQRLYEYLPASVKDLKRIEMSCSGFEVIYATSDVRKNILKWAVLCSLQKDCIAPPGAHVSCKFGSNSCDVYANCHRFDQSVLNILLLNRHNYNRSRYHFDYNIAPEQRKGRVNTSCVVAL